MTECSLFCIQDGFKDVSEFFVSEMSSLDHVITQSLRYNKLIYILQNLTISVENLLFRWKFKVI